MNKETIVLGLGNPLMADEGIGTAIVDRLSKLAEQFPDAEFLDAGTGGMNLLHIIAGRKKAIIIDCAFMGAAPGTIKRFTSDEVTSVKKLAHLSLHEADILQVIELSRKLGECPEEVIFFGIEPAKVEEGMNLSHQLTKKINDYIDTIKEELALHNRSN